MNAHHPQHYKFQTSAVETKQSVSINAQVVRGRFHIIPPFSLPLSPLSQFPKQTHTVTPVAPHSNSLHLLLLPGNFVVSLNTRFTPISNSISIELGTLPLLFVFFINAEMASLVERLRVRSDRRPIYTLDESDEEADLVKKKSGAGPSSDDFERFQRPDTVIMPPFRVFVAVV